MEIQSEDLRRIEEGLKLFEEDSFSAPQEAMVYAISRANLARAVYYALLGFEKAAIETFTKEVETRLIGT